MKIILFAVFALALTLSINSAEGKAACPQNTSWDGQNCTNTNTGEPIIFTDYLGKNIVKINKNNTDTEIENKIIIPQYEILRDLMIKKPDIKPIENFTGRALEQRLLDDMGQTNITRTNFHFEKIVEWTTKNAANKFNTIVAGKQIQNVDFGENKNPQIEYTVRLERSEDPVLQEHIVEENQKAETIFIINWGNFTNH